MRRSLALATLPVVGLLAACSGKSEPAPEPSASATVATPRTLVPADFDLATLGGRVAGMDTTEGADAQDAAPVTRSRSFVACAKDVIVCDPARLPAGTVYTYVVSITPEAEPVVAPTGSEGGSELTPAETPAELVRTAQPVAGFGGAVGFSRAEAAAALGAEDALTVTLDQGRLIWRVTGGSGWQPGRPITLWWQSTSAPQKPGTAYRLDHGGRHSDISAAFPLADRAVEPPAAR